MSYISEVTYQMQEQTNAPEEVEFKSCFIYPC